MSEELSVLELEEIKKCATLWWESCQRATESCQWCYEDEYACEDSYLKLMRLIEALIEQKSKK